MPAPTTARSHSPVGSFAEGTCMRVLIGAARPGGKACTRAIARGWCCGGLLLAQFGGGLAEQQPCDDQQLDLLGALEDVEDLGVARPLLEQAALALAEAAAELDAAERDVDAGAPGLGLGHRGLQRVGLAVVGH